MTNHHFMADYQHEVYKFQETRKNNDSKEGFGYRDLPDKRNSSDFDSLEDMAKGIVGRMGVSSYGFVNQQSQNLFISLYYDVVESSKGLSDEEFYELSDLVTAHVFNGE